MVTAILMDDEDHQAMLRIWWDCKELLVTRVVGELSHLPTRPQTVVRAKALFFVFEVRFGQLTSVRRWVGVCAGNSRLVLVALQRHLDRALERTSP